MTNVGPLVDGIPVGTDVDPIKFADSIGMLLRSIVGKGSGTAVGPLGSTGITPSIAGTSTPITPEQAATPDAGITMQGGTYTSGNETASPVPQGTGVESGFGVQRGEGNVHEGVDLQTPLGTTIVAATSGTVTAASISGDYGNLVEIRSPAGIITRYGHMSGFAVQVGDTVKVGQPIGTSGGEKGAPGAGNSTGPHLHFEVRTETGAVDPISFLAGGASIIVPGGGTARGSGKSGGTAAATPIPVSDQDAVDTGLARLVGALTGQPTGSQNARQAATINAAEGTAATTPGSMSGDDKDPNAIDSFLNAIKQQESGGDYKARNNSGLSNAAGAYQFIGTTWRGWGGSTESAADATPAEQDTVARRMAAALFQEFGSWRLVAIAWYQPAAAYAVQRGEDPGAPEGQGRFIDYGDTIARMMAGG